jgi:hypothetical protein
VRTPNEKHRDTCCGLHPEDQDIFRRVKTPIEMVDGTSNTAHARTAAQEFSDEVPETKAGQVVLTPP